MREKLIQNLKWSFFGPSREDNLEDTEQFDSISISDPGKLYITGILSPRLRSVDSEDDDDSTPINKTGVSDSSFGLTFSVPNSYNDSIKYGVSFSTYQSVKRDGKRVYERNPQAIQFDCSFSDFVGAHQIEKNIAELEYNGEVGLVKLVLSHRDDLVSPTSKIFTLSVMHLGKTDSGFRPWEYTLFHVEIWADIDTAFAPLPNIDFSFEEDEAQSALLYRNQLRRSIGHGCSSKIITKADGELICSTFFPVTEVPVVRHRGLEDKSLLSMLVLSDQGYDFSTLYKLIEEYKAWIELQSSKSSELTPDQKKVFELNLANVDYVCDRVARGIKSLETCAVTRLAFGLMNRAMLKQQFNYGRETSLLSKDAEKHGMEPIEINELDTGTWPVDTGKIYGQWRLFQLAFILMNVADFGSDNSDLDLIWFPTGGGKTEAYLGVTAFVLLMDRLKDNEHAGVKVLMRYTLRLLTAQQFERAASMILALDDLRSEYKELGNEEFSIGLWVGSSVTFNAQGSKSENWQKDTKTANHWYSNLSYKYQLDRKWPWVLQRCPRCARQFGVKKSGSKWKAYGVARNEKDKVFFQCKCSAKKDKSLPIYVVDDDVYAKLPSLLIGTVDKFARLSWKPISSKLLGVNAFGRGKHGKLRLVIQDELHLLEGPLGTIVGLYESAIDALIERTGAKPKKIGSSATLAMAKTQCKLLYGVTDDCVKVFPPALLDWDDNFFSHVDSDAPGRQYVGLYANGSPSNKTTQYRLYASLLQSGQEIYSRCGDDFESYLTLVNYFNSKKDMGHALSLMGDDVPREIRTLINRFNLLDNPELHRRNIDISSNLVQLHGNVSSDIVQRDMQRLSITRGNKNFVDVVLATNMISVGLDVPRLALMSIIHQPKTISEYIQASSRIGRGSTAGVVFVMLSSMRSRDKSILEDFDYTHKKMYSLVEPSSLTPYSSKALDRALPGVLIALFRNDPRFGMFDEFKAPTEEQIEEIRDFYLNRLKIIDERLIPTFEQHYNTFCKRWQSAGFQSFGSEMSKNSSSNRPLMAPYLTLNSSDVRPFQVLTSMRNVDSGILLKQEGDA